MLRNQNNIEILSYPKSPGREKAHVQGHHTALIHGFPRHLWSVKEVPDTKHIWGEVPHGADPKSAPEKGLELGGLLSIPGQTEARWG